MLEMPDCFTRFLKLPRVRRDGAWIAAVDCSLGTQVVVYDRQGRGQVLFSSREANFGSTITGLAWGPEGELWWSQIRGNQTLVHAAPVGGKPRVRWQGPGLLRLFDISPVGRLLMAHQHASRGVVVARPGEAEPLNVSVLGGTQVSGLSADGKRLLLLESLALDGGTPEDAIYLRDLEGGALRLAGGKPCSLSRDGAWVGLTLDGQNPLKLGPALTNALQKVGLDPAVPNVRSPYLLLMPTGPGLPLVVRLPAYFEALEGTLTHPDGRTLVFSSNEKGKGSAWYRVDRDGGNLGRITPEGFGDTFRGLSPLSPDGKQLIIQKEGTFYVQDLAGGEPRPLPMLSAEERIIAWTADGRGVYVGSQNDLLAPATIRVFRLSLATGTRTPWLIFKLPDPAGFTGFDSVYLSADGCTAAYTYSRQLSELYLVESVK